MTQLEPERTRQWPDWRRAVARLVFGRQVETGVLVGDPRQADQQYFGTGVSTEAMVKDLVFLAREVKGSDVHIGLQGLKNMTVEQLRNLATAVAQVNNQRIHGDKHVVLVGDEGELGALGLVPVAVEQLQEVTLDKFGDGVAIAMLGQWLGAQLGWTQITNGCWLKKLPNKEMGARLGLRPDRRLTNFWKTN